MAELVNRNIPLKWQIGWATDIGGGKENQDDFLVWEDKSSGTAVIAIFDGHGREVGKVAAQSAKEAMKKFLDENLSDLIATPTDALVAVHELAHTHIRNCFMDHFQRIGYEVKESDGYLLRRKLISENWSCIHGGTSCSVIAIVQSMMYIANVGDSTGILCSRRPVLCRSQMQYIRDSSLPSTVANNVSENREITMNAFKGCEKTMILTAEHSPECSYEYERLRLFRSREGDESLPSLRVIYDASSHDKSKCSTVFSNDSNGKLTLTNNGRYSFCNFFLVRLDISL